MITDSMITLWGDFFLFFLGEMDPVELPGWISTSSGYMSLIFGYAGQMGVWFNWSLLALVVGALLATNVFAFGMHLARMVVSVLTGGGGKA
jgi:hypothetical protein